MPTVNSLKNERIALYLDIFLGTVLSAFFLFCIIFTAITGGFTNSPISYVFGLVFWSCWLGLSIFLTALIIKSYYKEKHFDLTGEHKKPRKLKAPMVS